MMPSYPLLSVVFKKQVNSMKELYLLMEEEELNAQHSDNKTCTGDSWTQNTVRSQPISSPVLSICSFVCLVITSCCFLTPVLHQALEQQRVIAWSLAPDAQCYGVCKSPQGSDRGSDDGPWGLR